MSILKEIKKKKACKKKHIPNFNVILQVQDSYLVFDKLQNSILIICNINVSFALAKRFENGLKRRWLYPQLHVFIDNRFLITSSKAICVCAVTIFSDQNISMNIDYGRVSSGWLNVIIVRKFLSHPKKATSGDGKIGGLLQSANQRPRKLSEPKL